MSLQLLHARGERVPNAAADPVIGVGRVLRTRIVTTPRCARSLRPSTVRRTRRRKTREASTPEAAPSLPGGIPRAGPRGALTPVALMCLQTRAATVESTVTPMTATATTVTGPEDTPSAPMILTTQTTPAPSTGPSGTNTPLPTTTTASVAVSPEAGLGVTAGSAPDPGAAAAAAVVAAAGANGGAAALRRTAGRGAGATAGTAAGAPGALPRGQGPGRDPGATRAPRRGVLDGVTSSARKFTVPSLPTISDQAGEKVLGKKMITEEMMAKGRFSLRRTTAVRGERQKGTAAQKTRTPLLPNCCWRRSSQGRERGNPV